MSCAQLPASWKKGKRKALSLSQHALSRPLPAAGTRLDYSSHVFLASPRPAASAGAGASNRLLHEDVRSLGYRSLLGSSGSVSSFGFVVPAVRFQRRLAGNFGLATDSVGVPVSGCAVSCLFLLCTEPSSAKSGVESPSLYARARARVCVCVCASDSTSDCDCDCEGNGDCDCHCDCHCDCVRVCVWVCIQLACVCVCVRVCCLSLTVRARLRQSLCAWVRACAWACQCDQMYVRVCVYCAAQYQVHIPIHNHH